MTDRTPLSDSELDLAASLAIDGQDMPGRVLSAEERERVAARMAELRRAVAAVGEPVAPPPAEVKAIHITAAIAAAGTRAPSDGSPLTSATLLDRRATSLRGRARAAAPWAATAAAVLVVVLAVAALAGKDGSRSASTSAARGLAAAGASTTTVPTSAPNRPDVQGQTARADLGEVASPDALAARVRRVMASPSVGAYATTPAAANTLGQANAATTTTFGSPASPTSSASAASPGPDSATCPDQIGALRPPVGALVLRARAVLGTTPVVVLVFTDGSGPSGTHRLVAVAPTTCDILVDRTL